jgi:hypothetical protein
MGLAVTALSLAACGASKKPETCTELFGTGPGPASEAELGDILNEARDRFYPNLKGASIQLVPFQSTTDVFLSNLDLTTLGNAPLERHYELHYNTNMLARPPSRGAIGAILVHELKHTTDYVGMDMNTLAAFGFWYGLADDTNVAPYERATDERSLEDGCGPNLKAYRVWLYAFVDPSVLAAKEAEYYTPDEIDAWMAAHPDVQ